MKKLLLSLLMLWGCGSLSAQGSKYRYVKPVNFSPETYIGVSGGLNVFAGEGVGGYLKNMPMKAVGTSVGMLYGVQYTPLWGARLQMSMDAYHWPNQYKKYEVLDMSVMNASLQATMNLSYLLWGYDEERRLDLDMVGGLGAAYRYKADYAKTKIFPKINGGLQFNYRAAERIMLHLSGELNLLPDAFNNVPVSGTTGIPVDIVPEVKLSLTYRLPNYKYKIYRARGRR